MSDYFSQVMNIQREDADYDPATGGIDFTQIMDREPITPYVPAMGELGTQGEVLAGFSAGVGSSLEGIMRTPHVVGTGIRSLGRDIQGGLTPITIERYRSDLPEGWTDFIPELDRRWVDRRDPTRARIGEFAEQFGTSVTDGFGDLTRMSDDIRLARETRFRPSEAAEVPWSWRWFAYNVPSGLGNATMMVGPGLAVGGVSRLSATVGATIGGSMEAGLKYEDFRGELVELGYSDAEAERIASYGAIGYGVAAGTVETLPLMAIFRKAPSARKLFTNAIVAALSEGTEESIQEILENTTRVLAGIDEDAIRNMTVDELLQMFVIGGFTGGIFGTGVGSLTIGRAGRMTVDETRSRIMELGYTESEATQLAKAIRGLNPEQLQDVLAQATEQREVEFGKKITEQDESGVDTESPNQVIREQIEQPAKSEPAEQAGDVLRVDEGVPVEPTTEQITAPESEAVDPLKQISKETEFGYRVEQAAIERIRRRNDDTSVTLGMGLGGANKQIGNLGDYSIIFAVRAARMGIKGSKAVRAFVEEQAKHLDSNTRKFVNIIAQETNRILRTAVNTDGTIDEEKLSRAGERAHERLNRAQQEITTKQQISQSVKGPKPEPSVTEPKALAAVMRAQRRAARISAREERRKANIERRAALADIRNRNRQKDSDIRQNRRELTEHIKNRLPKSERGELLTALRDIRTRRQLEKAIIRVEEAHQRVEHRKAERDLNRVITRARRAVKRPEFKRPLEAILNRIDPSKPTKKTRKRLESLQKFIDENPNADIPAKHLNSLDRLTRTPIQDMDIEEIREATEAIKTLIHINNTKNRLLSVHRNRTIDEYANEISDEVSERKGLLSKENLTMLGRMRLTLGLDIDASHLKPADRNAVVKFFAEGATRPEQILEELSPKLRELIYEQIGVEGFRQELEIRHREIQSIINSLAENNIESGTPGFLRWKNEIISVPVLGGTARMSRGQAMMLYLHTKDASNRQEMLETGLSDKVRGVVHMFDQAHLDQISDAIGPEATAVAEAMHKRYNGEIAGEVNEKWIMVHGREIVDRTDHTPRRRDRDLIDTERDAGMPMKDWFRRSMEGRKQFKERTGSNAPLLLEDAFDVFTEHMTVLSRTVAYLDKYRDAEAILGDARLKNEIINRYGKDMLESIRRRMHEQVVGLYDFTPEGKYSRPFKNNAGLAILGLRPFTALKNPAGIFVSASHTNPMDMLRSIGAPLSEWRRIDQIARQHSPYWVERYNNFFHQATSGISGSRISGFDPTPIRQKALAHIEFTDKVGAVIRWKEAERRVRRERPELEAGSDEYWGQVSRAWERSMFRGENTAHPMEMSAMIAAGRRNPMLGLMVMFQSSASKLYANMRRGIVQINHGEIESGIKTLTLSVASFAWLVAINKMRQALTGVGDDDEDEESQVAELLTMMGTEAANTVPLFGTAIKDIINVFGNGHRSYRYPETPLLQAMYIPSNMTWNVMQAISHLREDDPEEAQESLKRVADGLMEFLSLMTGIPWSGPKDIKRIMDHLFGEDDED